MPEFQPAGPVRTHSAKLPKRSSPPSSYRPQKNVFPGNPQPLKCAAPQPTISSFTVKSASAPILRQSIPAGDSRSSTLPRHVDPRAQRPVAQHPFVDVTIQRALVSDEHAMLKRKRIEQWQAAAKLPPKEGRHSLLMLVAEAYRWRQDIAQHAQESCAAACSDQPNNAPGAEAAPHRAVYLPPYSVREAPAVLNVHSNPDEYYGVVADIESLMTKPDVVQSGDSKNVYQKILQNLGQLGLFRPEPAGLPLLADQKAPPGLAPDY